MLYGFYLCCSLLVESMLYGFYLYSSLQVESILYGFYLYWIHIVWFLSLLNPYCMVSTFVESILYGFYLCWIHIVWFLSLLNPYCMVSTFVESILYGFYLCWIHIVWFVPCFSRTFPRSLQQTTPRPWMSIPLPGGWGWWTRTTSPTLCLPPVGGAPPCCLSMVGPILPPLLCSHSLSLSLSRTISVSFSCVHVSLSLFNSFEFRYFFKN